jgi:hypothetical protein
MTIDIVPAGSTGVVTEHRKDKHPDRWDLSTEMQRDFVELTNQAERNQAATVVRDTLTADQVKSQADRYHSLSTVQGTLTQQELASGFAQALVDSGKNAASISVQSQSETNELANQATNNYNLGSVQSTSNFNLASVQAVQFSMMADISRQKFAYEAQLQAEKIASSAAAKAAECCCELKTAIGAEGQRTRDLINSTTEQNLRDRAMRSEQALAAYFSAKVAPITPIS